MKELLLEIGDWLNYCRIKSYKENKKNEEIADGTIVELNKQIENVKKDYEEKEKQSEFIAKEKDNLIKLLNNRIDALNEKISSVCKRNNELRSILQATSNELDSTKEELAKEKISRKKCAGAVGGLTARVNSLTKELKQTTGERDMAMKSLDQAKYTINFYKTHQKSPSIEELKAYEYSRKEVEKRMKNEK